MRWRPVGGGAPPDVEPIPIFGGEYSGHYYFRDFWRADTGMLAAMHVLAALGEQDRPLSELVSQYTRYAASGEINSQVPDPAATLQAVGAGYADAPGAEIDWLDGLTVSYGNLWSTCARPTLNPCCGSTSKDPIPRRWSGCAMRCWHRPA